MEQVFNIVLATVGSEQINTVNARDLHKFLGVKTQFSIWLTKRIDKFKFKEDEDFVKVELPAGQAMTSNFNKLSDFEHNQKILAVESMGYESFGQQGRIEYAISINMAKELSMIENNDKGREARKYFIECERIAKQLTKETIKIPTTYLEALKNLIQAEEAKAILAIELEAAAPKIEFVDNYVEYEGSLCLRDGFKSIAKKPQIFTKQLIKDGVFYVNGNGQVCSKQAHIDAQHFKHKITEYGVQVRVTHKGLVYLTKKYK